MHSRRHFLATALHELVIQIGKYSWKLVQNSYFINLCCVGQKPCKIKKKKKKKKKKTRRVLFSFYYPLD